MMIPLLQKLTIIIYHGRKVTEQVCCPPNATARLAAATLPDRHTMESTLHRMTSRAMGNIPVARRMGGSMEQICQVEIPDQEGIGEQEAKGDRNRN